MPQGCCDEEGDPVKMFSESAGGGVTLTVVPTPIHTERPVPWKSEIAGRMDKPHALGTRQRIFCGGRYWHRHRLLAALWVRSCVDKRQTRELTCVFKKHLCRFLTKNYSTKLPWNRSKCPVLNSVSAWRMEAESIVWWLLSRVEKSQQRSPPEMFGFTDVLRNNLGSSSMTSKRGCALNDTWMVCVSYCQQNTYFVSVFGVFLKCLTALSALRDVTFLVGESESALGERGRRLEDRAQMGPGACCSLLRAERRSLAPSELFCEETPRQRV